MRAGMQGFLQPDVRDQLRQNFQMAAAASAISEMYDNGTVVLCCQLVVHLQQLPSQSHSSLAPLLLFRRDFPVKNLRSLLDSVALFLQGYARYLHSLFL